MERRRSGSGRRVASLFVALAVAVAGTVGGPGSGAVVSAGSKAAPVDPVLASQARKDPAAVVPVVIERSSDAAAVAAVQARGGKTGRQLKIRKGLAAEVPAGALDALAREPGVLRIAYDAPLLSKATPDPLSGANLQTVYQAAVHAEELWTGLSPLRGTSLNVLACGRSNVEDLSPLRHASGHRVSRGVKLGGKAQGSPVPSGWPQVRGRLEGRTPVKPR